MSAHYSLNPHPARYTCYIISICEFAIGVLNDITANNQGASHQQRAEGGYIQFSYSHGTYFNSQVGTDSPTTHALKKGIHHLHTQKPHKHRTQGRTDTRPPVLPYVRGCRTMMQSSIERVRTHELQEVDVRCCLFIELLRLADTLLIIMLCM